LQKRYEQLVGEHLGQAQSTAAGLRLLPGDATTWASTMAAWRFWRNPRVSPHVLIQPLLAAASQAVADHCLDYVLAIHDWSDLDYATHASKRDRIVLGQATERGYELHSCLLVGDQAGEPLAPVYQGLKAADGLISSRHCRVQPVNAAVTNLDGVVGLMQYVRRLGLARPVVHLIDAEADSVAHFRAWDHARQNFVVRVQGRRVVRHAGQRRSLAEVVRWLQDHHALTFSREVLYHGRPAQQFVAEATVVLYRSARPSRKAAGPWRRKVAGRPLTLRLVVSHVRDAQGNRLAEWLLLTNVLASVNAATVALWYYWRWRIESYFKLLKAAGQQLEHWQQETALALAKRLLVASMACVLVWQVARDERPEAETLRQLLVRLSGRLVRREPGWTYPALLAGLWVLLAALAVLRDYPADRLRDLAAGIKRSGDRTPFANLSSNHRGGHGPSP
jgi:hypothetical protein